MASLPQSYDPPPGKDEQSCSRYTWSFNPSDIRLPMLPPEPVSSYLTFSPLSRQKCRDGYFLLHYYTLADIFPLGSMALFVARTFLPPPTGEERWNGLLPCKSTTFFLFLHGISGRYNHQIFRKTDNDRNRH